MSDLAPFVAASLRDKVVMELEEELKLERAKTKQLQDVFFERWTIRIESSPVDGQVPVVYAIGNINLQDVLINLRFYNPENIPLHEFGIAVEMKPVDTANPCRFSSFLQSKITLVSGHGRELCSMLIGRPEACCDNHVSATDGRFEMHWYLNAESDDDDFIDWIDLDVPIPTDRWGLATPEALDIMGRDEALPLAMHLTNDGPIRFTDVSLNAYALAGLMREEED